MEQSTTLFSEISLLFVIYGPSKCTLDFDQQTRKPLFTELDSWAPNHTWDDLLNKWLIDYGADFTENRKVVSQAPAERRQVFSSEMQRVGIAGAKVLREIGNKVKKMEKLGSGDILFEVHQAAEELQKKIDKRSYLLVNSEAWEIGNRPVDVEDGTHALDMMESNNQFLGTKSLSEAVLDLRPVSLSTSWDNRQPIMVLNSSIPPGGSPETLSRAQVPWSAWHSFNHGAIPDELSSRTYESASALSLATFASLLIEFVARLQNVVTTFEELSEKANFKEPVDGAAEEVVGFWTRLSRLLRFKD